MDWCIVKMKKNKKGQIQQIVYLMVLIFSVILTILVAKYIMVQFNQGLEDEGLHTTESREALVQMDTAFPTLDNAILGVIIFLSIGLIITSFFIPTHPIFLFINIIGIFFLCFLGMVLSNLYADIITNSDELASVYSSFPKLNFVMNQLPWIAAILVFIVTIVQFIKWREYG
jgi:hypothetical protein